MRTARDKTHVDAGRRQAAAEVSTDTTCADDCDTKRCHRRILPWRLHAAKERAGGRGRLVPGLLDEDHPHLERIVLSVVRPVDLEIAMLVLSNQLEAVVEWHVQIRSHRPLIRRFRRVRNESVVPNAE